MPNIPKIKCRQCGRLHPKAEAIKLPNRFWFCSESCANQWMAEHKNKGKPIKQKPKEDYSPLRKLTDYVQTYAPDTDWIKFVQYVKKLQDDYKLAPQAIHYCLWYIREHLRLAFDGSGLPLVPWYAESARRYYNWRKRMQQVVADWRLEDNTNIVMKREVEEDVFE